MRSEALGEVCHALRTPLGAVIGYAEVLAAADTGDMELDEATRKEFLADLLRAARGMQRVLDELQGVPASREEGAGEAATAGSGDA